MKEEACLQLNGHGSRLAGLRWNHLIEWSFALLQVAGAGVGALLISDPNWFLAGFH